MTVSATVGVYSSFVSDPSKTQNSPFTAKTGDSTDSGCGTMVALGHQIPENEMNLTPPSEGRPSDAQRRARIWILGALFTCTGCTALLVEQAFEKLLSTLVGASTPAAATVLAVYFGGLTLGGVLYASQRRAGSRRPLRTYALLEGAVALWALCLYLSFGQLVALFRPLLSAGVDHPGRLVLLRFLVAALWILPATVPMGATFPAIVDGLEEIGDADHRRTVTRFYGWNLMGAVLGSIGGPFFAFPHWGVEGVLLFAFFVNSSACLVALLLARSARCSETERRTEAPPPAEASSYGVLIGIAAYSGFQFFALEVLWTHLIGAALGTSVYAFAAMLGIVLIGLGLGALLSSLQARSRPTVTVAAVGSLLVVGAIFLAATSGRWPEAPGALVTYGSGIHTFGAAELLRWGMAALLLLPTATALGMIYPTLFRLSEFPASRSGRMAGRLVAANALGSIAGALVTGFVLIPRIGSEWTLILLTCLAAAFGLWALAGQGRSHRRARVAAALAIAVAVLQPRWNKLDLTSGQQVYFAPSAVGPATRLRLFHEDTLGGFTTVVQNVGGDGRPYLTLLTNGKFQGNDSSEMPAQTGFALTPALFVPVFDRALSIGLGTGRTAYVLAELGFPRVDVAEIAPGITRAAPLFSHVNGSVLLRPTTRLFVEDGRNILLLRPEKYDLVTIEIASIWFAGATNLYSEEFYQLVRDRLRPGGVLQQWIQLHHLGFDELGSVIATARSVFPFVTFWRVSGQGLIVASMNPQEIQPTFLRATRERASRWGWNPERLEDSLRDLVSSRLLAPDDTGALVAHSRFVLNTDRNRRLEYLTPRYNHVPLDYATMNFRKLASWASFAPPLVSPDAHGALAEACRRVTRGDYLRAHGLPSSAEIYPAAQTSRR